MSTFFLLQTIAHYSVLVAHICYGAPDCGIWGLSRSSTVSGFSASYVPEICICNVSMYMSKIVMTGKGGRKRQELIRAVDGPMVNDWAIWSGLD